MKYLFLITTLLFLPVVFAVCGDGVIELTEDCDDDNLVNGDGCSNICSYESYYVCEGEPSSCQYLGEVYGWFNDFSLNHFGAESDELIYERQGNSLEFVESGEWNYASENSASIAYETNLPSKSYIEWGTSNGNYNVGRTYVEERFFYLHLHYMRELQPNTLYHYRIVSRDERGNIIYSPDKTITTITYPNKIELTSPGPHDLTQANTVYIFKNDIVSDTKGIAIKANGVTLDLNGFTLTYDNGNPIIPEGLGWNDYYYNTGNATFGITVENNNNHDNYRILNGEIKQGANQGKGTIGFGFNPVVLKGDNFEMAGVSIDYNGSDVHGITGHYAGLGEVHHNVITAESSTHVTDRHQAVRSIYGNGNWYGHHNLVKRAYHQVFVNLKDSHDNEGYLDSYDTNAFMLSPGNNVRAYNNKLFGTGYMVMAISWSNNITIEDNLVYLHGIMTYGRSTEYDQGCSMTGIRLTQYGGSENVYQNNVYQNNYIIVKAQDGCEQIRGTGISSDPFIENITIQNNVFKIIALDNNTALANEYGGLGCFNIQGLSERSEQHLPVFYLNNLCISNFRFINFGESYGSGSNTYFKGNTFRKVGNHVNYHPIRLGFWIYHSYGHKIIDSILEGGADLTDNFFIATATTLDYSLGHSLQLRVLDGSSLAYGARVRFFKEDGTILEEGFVNSQGEYYYDVIETFINYSGTFTRIPIRLLVEYEGNVQTQDISITQATQLDIVFGGSCSSGESRTCGLDTGACTYGTQSCNSDGTWGVCQGAVLMSEEICNGEDDDCNGLTDEYLGTTTCGEGVCNHTITNCVGGIPQVCNPFEGVLFEDYMTNCDNGVDESCSGEDSICAHFIEQEDSASTFTCDVTDLLGIAKVELLGDSGSGLQVVDSESFVDDTYLFLETESFQRSAHWTLCPGESCETDWSREENFASGLEFVYGYRGDNDNVLSLINYSGIPSGDYYFWARSFQRNGNQDIRRWFLESGSFQSEDFGDLGTHKFEWENGGVFPVQNEIRIRPSTFDYYVANPDVILLTTDANFNPSIDCGVDASNLLGGESFPIGYSLGTCGIVNTHENVVFNKPSGFTSFECRYIDGTGSIIGGSLCVDCDFPGDYNQDGRVTLLDFFSVSSLRQLILVGRNLFS